MFGVWSFSSFAIMPDFVDDLVKVGDARRRAVHAGKKLVHEPLPELLAFGVAPGIARLRPRGCQLFGERF